MFQERDAKLIDRKSITREVLICQRKLVRRSTSGGDERRNFDGGQFDRFLVIASWHWSSDRERTEFRRHETEDARGCRLEATCGAVLETLRESLVKGFARPLGRRVILRHSIGFILFFQVLR